MAEEIGNLLKNIAVEKVHMKKVSAKSQFVSNLLLVMKEDGCNRTVKNLNQYIPHHYFKTESLNSLRDILKQGNFMYKLDLKDAYFCIPLAEESKKFTRFYWEWDLYQFLCLCFELVPAPYVFPKLLKIPIAFLWRIGTLIIIYLYDMLLVGRTVENVQMYRDTVALLLQELRFLIKLKKWVVTPSQEMELLGMVINSTSIHIQMDNKVALTYLKKMEETKNQKMAILTVKEIWDILISEQIMITVEYLPSSLTQWQTWNLVAKWTHPNESSVDMSFATSV